jgi:hypothetical protein
MKIDPEMYKIVEEVEAKYGKYPKPTFDTDKMCDDIIRKNCSHDWQLTWPLDPEEYTCKKCGVKNLR